MKTSKFELLSDNVLTVSEMFNVRGGDGDEGEGQASTNTTTTGSDIDIIL